MDTKKETKRLTDRIFSDKRLMDALESVQMITIKHEGGETNIFNGMLAFDPTVKALKTTMDNLYPTTNV